jgi:hypothetical protein
VTLNDWKGLAITQVILAEFKRRQRDLKEELAISAGVNPLDDRFKAGVIAAYEDVVNIELDDDGENS